MRLGRSIACAALIGAVATAAHGRDQIRVVGSSTVAPFASYVAEELGKTTDHATPVIESTGTGGGFKLFCQGDGPDTPDISNASRPIKASEFKHCQENGVSSITEAKFGYDGIVLARSVEGERLSLSREQITLAVAAEVPKDGELVANPYKRWSQIDPDLPDMEITIYGPPTTSGTRDAFEELVMEAGSEAIEGYSGAYTQVRNDGPYIAQGENDNVIVQKIARDREALGIFGYSFLEENQHRIQGMLIDGVAPEPAKISSGEYPVSRSLFFYVKNAHYAEVAGMEDFVSLFLSEKMISEFGYLKRLGLIPLPKAERERMRKQVSARKAVSLSDIE